MKLKSRKGFLLASYDKNGELVKTYQKFKNIAIPSQLKREIYQTYTGYTIIKNKYVASGKGNRIDKEQYQFTLRNGRDKLKIKLVPAGTSSVGRVVTNY